MILCLHNQRKLWRSKFCFYCLLLASSVVNSDVSCPDSASLLVLAGPLSILLAADCIFPRECLGTSDDVNFQRDATCSCFLRAAALAACGEFFCQKVPDVQL